MLVLDAFWTISLRLVMGALHVAINLESFSGRGGGKMLAQLLGVRVTY